MNFKKYFFLLVNLIFLTSVVFAQESLKSVEEDYYYFLALNGKIERPYLNYRTLSDSSWDIEDLSEEDNIWAENVLSSNYSPFDNFKIKVFYPELYQSYNSAAPYGQNDGGLWQGKGYNSSLSAGFHADFYGFELNVKPLISFSQNQVFGYPASVYKGSQYKDKAQEYGYYGFSSIDAPQRFGNTSFFNFDLGDTELRYTYKNFTLGFGNEYIWLGPAQINPILHSNNAASYPKLDFGVRKQSLSIKNINFGAIEFRYWLGKLTESEYFDNDDSNNNNLIAGLAASYELPFLPGFIVSFNRTMLSKWNNINPYTCFSILIPAMKYEMGYDESDQRAELVFEYFIPKGEITIYFEWAKNDYNNGFDNIMRYPFHTQALTTGFVKNVHYNNFLNLKGQLLFELTFIESSMDYYFFYDWDKFSKGNSFYTHHKVTQGYTNRGQYLGAGIGSGGNSQYLSYRLYYPKGETTLFFQRTNPDLNYFYFQAPRDDSETPKENVKKSIRVKLDVGIESVYFINSNLRLTGAFIFEDDQNPMNVNKNIETGSLRSEHRINIVTQLGIKYNF